MKLFDFIGHLVVRILANEFQLGIEGVVELRRDMFCQLRENLLKDL